MDSVEITYEDALRLKEEKVLFGLAKKVKYSIRPLELEVEANADNTTIKVEDVELKVTTEAKKAMGSCSKKTAKELRRIFDDALQIEKDIKSGNINGRLALELFIGKL